MEKSLLPLDALKASRSIGPTLCCALSAFLTDSTIKNVHGSLDHFLSLMELCIDILLVPPLLTRSPPNHQGSNYSRHPGFITHTLDYKEYPDLYFSPVLLFVISSTARFPPLLDLLIV
jgi:hypothetical protein